jgi:hypothetical protein
VAFRRCQSLLFLKCNQQQDENHGPPTADTPLHDCAYAVSRQRGRQSANQSKQGELSSFDVPISRHEFHWSRFHPFPRVCNLVETPMPPFVLFSNKEETIVHNFLRFLKIGPFSSSYTFSPVDLQH